MLFTKQMNEVFRGKREGFKKAAFTALKTRTFSHLLQKKVTSIFRQKLRTTYSFIQVPPGFRTAQE